jgi:hypothetical protein
MSADNASGRIDDGCFVFPAEPSTLVHAVIDLETESLLHTPVGNDSCTSAKSH